MRSIAIVLVSTAIACADVERGDLLWQAPSECPLDASLAEDATTYAGDPAINTLHVTVFRLPGTVSTCGDCIMDEACQPVRFECRCGPSGSIEDAAHALRDVRFDDLDPTLRYCVRVAQFDFDINETSAWGPACDEGFSCAGLLGRPQLIEERVRACSVSEVVRFGGSVDIAQHRCRATMPGGVRACMRLP